MARSCLGNMRGAIGDHPDSSLPLQSTTQPAFRVILHGADGLPRVTIGVMIDPHQRAPNSTAQRPATALTRPFRAPGESASQPAASAGGEEPVVTGSRSTPRATRRVEGRLIGGVAGGLADHLGVSALSVRIVFAVLAWFGGFGVLLYGVLWFVMPQANQPETPVGIAAATRLGKRTPARRRAEDIGQIVALAFLGVGVVALVQFVGLGVSAKIFWPLIFALTGVALIWRQADEAQRARWVQASPRLPVVGTLLGRNSWAAAARFVLGMALVGASVATFLVQSERRGLYADVLLGVLLALAGVALILGPLVYRLASDLTAERAERVRSQERADMAAHLHDSVLQTLALIQQKSSDPRRVAALARSQERELRDWLYADTSPSEETLSSALRRMSAEVEKAHGVPVEVVTVGDVGLNDDGAAMLRAAREAMVNAARHSGADKIDVFAEVTATGVQLFVRDRGSGFDADGIPPDRLGVRRSIEGRMERHGGKASVRSTRGQGTEISLTMPDEAVEATGEATK
jgi:signal transduction histidine kinase/phage shock protein PspC (stress-responsive transcriptional regulator)